jgi:anti-sigma regulatory factor (Ser/Thr protein kinase)
VATLDREFAARADAAQEARTIVRRELADAISAPLLYDLLTVVSELVTNAVQHGKPEPVRLQIDVTSRGDVFGEVVNAGEGRPAERHIEADGSGLGLHIVGEIADRWTATVEAGTTRVRFVLKPP